jgi:uncharacterized RDD family membrane protein YckC
VKDDATPAVPPRSDAVNPITEPPSLARRFGALLVDWGLCVLVSGFFGDPIQDGWPPVVVLIVVYGFFIGLFAQTPGMWVSRLGCVSYADGGRIGVLRALLRGVLLTLIVPAVIMDRERRGLHDRVAGSVVIDLPSRSIRPGTAPTLGPSR